MFRWLIRGVLLMFVFALVPRETPAPLVYRRGEGWSWEPIGGKKWVRTRAKDQLDVAQEAFDKKDFGLARKAARRTVRVWPLSDYAPQAQYLVGRSYEARGNDERAFHEYQKLLEKYPKVDNYDDVLARQFAIANRYLAGKWFRLWGYIPFFRSMEKTSKMLENVIKNGPYSEIAPQAQLSIGAAREKQKNFPLAVKAYETAADRYHDNAKVAAEGLYRAGLAYHKQAKKAEYDQSVAGKAIATFTDFITLFPQEPRVPEAQKIIADLRTEQARGALQVARFYEKKRRWSGALVYYNEVVIKDPNSTYAQEAKERIEVLKIKTQQASVRRP